MRRRGMKILSLVHTHSFLFEKTEIFGPVWPNVSVKNDHPKRIFSKTVSRKEVSENAFLMLWMDEYIFFTYYVTVFDTNKCACSL